MNKLGVQGFTGLILLIACFGALLFFALTDSKNESNPSNNVKAYAAPSIPLGNALSPRDYEVHYLDTYTGIGVCDNSFRCVVNVEVDKLDKPIILVLTAYDPIHWHINKHPETIIKKVIVSGYNEQTVSGIPSNIPIDSSFYTGSALTPKGQYFYGGFIRSRAQYLRVTAKIKRLTGQHPKSVQSVYNARFFKIDRAKNDFKGTDEPEAPGVVSTGAYRVSQPTIIPYDEMQNNDLESAVSEMRQQILHNWDPPVEDRYKRVVVSFKLSSDGRLLSLYTKQSSGSVEADRAALEAIRRSAPFQSLPNRNVEFIFDYNDKAPKRHTESE